MKDETTKVKITIPFPVGRPDRNGNVFTKKAIESAVNTLHKNLPIVYDNENGREAIGATTGTSHIATWDNENQVCKLTVDGVLYNSGPEIVVNKIKDGEVSSFEIVGFWMDKVEE